MQSCLYLGQFLSVLYTSKTITLESSKCSALYSSSLHQLVKYIALENSWTALEVLPWKALEVVPWTALAVVPWAALEVLLGTALEVFCLGQFLDSS